MTNPTHRKPWTEPLTPQEVAYMRLECAMPDKPSWAAQAQLTALAAQLDVEP